MVSEKKLYFGKWIVLCFVGWLVMYWGVLQMKSITKENDGVDQSYLWMLKELGEAKKKGIPAIVNGKEFFYPERKKTGFVCENAVYMEDYIADSQGRIIQIHFNKIRDLPDE